MSKQKRTITNESGKQITMMIDPENTLQHIWNEVEWTISPSQWRRLVRESDNTAWRTERGATIRFTCHPHAAACRYPGFNGCGRCCGMDCGGFNREIRARRQYDDALR